MSVFPAGGQKANLRAPALIEDRISLPARLASLHEGSSLSARQIAARLGVSHSAVLMALGRLGIACGAPRNGHALRGRVPFGWDIQDARLVKNGAEQQVIRLIRQLQGSGESLNAIAHELNRRLVPTKKAGIWQANTVGKILRRMAGRVAS